MHPFLTAEVWKSLGIIVVLQLIPQHSELIVKGIYCCKVSGLQIYTLLFTEF